MDSRYDGYVSRFINRRVSGPLARGLAGTKITPNQVTWAAFGLALLSFLSFVFGQNIIGGLLAQLSSIIDGVDGELARLKRMTSEFGGFLDAVLDRYADVLILLGLTIWSVSNESYPGIWLVGLLAATGSISISYTRARIGPEYKNLFDRGFQSLASRDVRLLLVMLGAVAGQAYFCLFVIAVLTNLLVFYRLALVFRNTGK
ncbi:MAG: CDP-alcohol phosphatidyltransferase family protein [Dehalococcoidales bacterium]